MKDGMIRSIVIYGGEVQGVGFRYTASRTAGDYAVDGTVRNLSDGRVELIAEGRRREVNAFLEAIAARMGNHIRHSTRSDSPATGACAGFRVVH